MPRLAHTTPCSDCPWRRVSAPGWLGAATPEQFLAAAQHETPMPCHCAIDYEDPDWRDTQLPQAPLCAGALTFLRQTGKLPRDTTLAAAVRAVEPDPGVFSTPAEFLDHHRSGPSSAAPQRDKRHAAA